MRYYVLVVALLAAGCGNNITKPTPITPPPSYVIPPHTCYEIIDGIFHEIPCATAQAPAR